MGERLDLDIDGEGEEARPPRKPAVIVPDPERPADPDDEEALADPTPVPSDEQEVPLADEP